MRLQVTMEPDTRMLTITGQRQEELTPEEQAAPEVVATKAP